MYLCIHSTHGPSSAIIYTKCLHNHKHCHCFSMVLGYAVPFSFIPWIWHCCSHPHQACTWSSWHHWSQISLHGLVRLYWNPHPQTWWERLPSCPHLQYRAVCTKTANKIICWGLPDISHMFTYTCTPIHMHLQEIPLRIHMHTHTQTHKHTYTHACTSPLSHMPTHFPPLLPVVYNHWTGLVDWTGGLDWWTGLVDWFNNHFYAC